jgi:hypothetical protein
MVSQKLTVNISRYNEPKTGKWKYGNDLESHEVLLIMKRSKRNKMFTQ